VGAAFLAACLGLGLNVTAALERVPDPPLDNLPPRFWQDLHMAQALYLFGEFPVTANEVTRWRDAAGVLHAGELHPHIALTVAEAGMRPWEFWRVVRENRFRRPAQRVLVDRYDDSGRPLLLGLAFRARHGIAPFLLFWLGPLLALPLLAWTAAELVAAEAWTAAAALLVLLGAWPFLADALALAYSTAGFSVLALLAGLPLAVHAGLARRTSAGGLLVRAALTGLALALAVLVRGGALLTIAGPVLAVAWACRRIETPAVARRGRRPLIFAAGIASLVLPIALARAAVNVLVTRTAAAYGQPALSPQRHALWFGIWSGLGDFDRQKGHQWLDRAASEAAVAAGGTPLRSTGYDPANEPIYRRLVLADIRSDPAWYAGILARRLGAILTQRKLWPWPPLGGRSLEPARDPAEGAIDAYYSLTTPSDRFGAGGAQAELPVPLLLAPAAAVLLQAARGGRARGAAVVMGLVAASALPLPLLVTTASAVETEAFVLVYVVGVALGLDLLRARLQEQGAVPQAR